MRRRLTFAALLLFCGLLGAASADDRPGAEPGRPEPAKAPEKKKAEPPKASPREIPDALRAAPPKTLDQAMTRLGTMRVDVDVKDYTLPMAIEFIAAVSRMNVMASPALQAAGMDGIPLVTLKLRDASLRQTTELFAKMTATKLVVREGVLMFTTEQDARGKPVLRIYSLAELTFKLRNFPGPDIQLHLASVEFEDEKESDVESALDDPEVIVDLIKKMTGEGTWSDDDVSISADQRRLVVRQYAPVQKEIARLLALLRAAK